MKTSGFINDFGNAITNAMPVQSEWAELVATTTLSSAMEGNIRIGTRYGQLNLNLFSVCIGPSGIAHKTAPLKYFCIPLLQKTSQIAARKAGEEENIQPYDLILPSGFSSEGMIEYLDEKRNSGVILKDEFSTLVKGSKNKSYQSDLCEIMSQFYDGFVMKRYTRKAKLDHAVNCTISMIGTTTPFAYRLLDDEFFSQGLGNRIIWNIFPADIEDTSFFEDDIFYDPHQMQQRDSMIEAYADTLSDWLFYGRDSELWINPTDKASSMINEFATEKENLARTLYRENALSIKSSYANRLLQKTLKLAGLHAVSRNFYDPDSYVQDSYVNTMEMTEQDVTWAIDRAEQYYESFELLLDQKNLYHAEAQKVKTYQQYLDRAISILKMNDGKMKHYDFRREMGIRSEELDTVINELVEQKRLVSYQGEGSSKGGPKPTIHKLLDYETDGEEDGAAQARAKANEEYIL